MKPIALALSCLLLAPAAFAQEAPGDKWVECKVGQGGRASAEDVYRELVAALDKGDVAAVRALLVDRCPLFRVASMAGYEFAAGIREVRDNGPWERVVKSLHARIQVEGTKLAKAPFEVVEHTGGGDFTMGTDGNWVFALPLPQVTVTTRNDMRLRLAVNAVAIDGRWFLYDVPTMTGSDEALDKRYGVLVRELAKRVGKLQGDKAVAVVDAWHKKHEVELTTLGAAASATKSSSPRKAYGVLETALGPIDAALGKRLAALGLGGKRVGVASCDAYLANMERCMASLPPAAQGALSEGLAQVVDAWRGVVEASPEGASALEVACKSAIDASASAMESICPGVW